MILLFCLYGVWMGVWVVFRECFVIFGFLTGLVVWARFMRFDGLLLLRYFLVYFLGEGVGFM